ncbi:MAG: AMP-binding protein [Pseudomonadota bacterium]
MNFAMWLQRTADIAPDRPALYLGTQLMADYAAFRDRAASLGQWITAQGIRPGDHVAVFMTNAPDYLIAQYGIWYAGAVAVLVNAKLHGKEAAFILSDSGTKAVFASPDQAEALRDAGVACPIIESGSEAFLSATTGPGMAQPVARRADDLCWLFYTSGTTGRPKGVMITNRMLMTMSLCYEADVDHVRADDAVIYAAPMSHGAGIYNMLHVRQGAKHVCPVSGGFDPAEIFDLARSFGSVQMFAAPTMVKRMTDVARATGARGDGLRTVVYAGGPMYVADIMAAVDYFGPVFVQIYGQGECPMGITALSRADVADRSHPRWRERLASVGRAQSAVEVAIGGPDGSLLAPGHSGEILVRGDTVMPGYWNNTTATAKTLRDGWLMTGDVGHIDDDGYLTMQDRSKDMIITGGSNVYPREVEEVLLQHPQVEEAAVVGRTHPEWGEEVIAFVVGTAPPEALDQLCIDNIARFKRPKAYVSVANLPKNNYGKVLKTELRQRLSKKT